MVILRTFNIKMSRVPFTHFTRLGGEGFARSGQCLLFLLFFSGEENKHENQPYYGYVKAVKGTQCLPKIAQYMYTFCAADDLLRCWPHIGTSGISIQEVLLPDK